MGSETVAVTGETKMVDSNQNVTRDDSRFLRLRHLFWHKIARNQRLRVLVELGMLPSDSKIAPIWVWRGLDAARRQGKLKGLWDSVMSQLPDERQEDNPFVSINLTKQV